MKTVAAAIQTMLDAEVHTLAICWKLTPVSGTPLYFTSHDQDLVVSGNTYKSTIGFNASTVSTQSGLQVDNLDVQSFLSSMGITKTVIEQGVYDGATVEVFAVDYTNPSAGIVKLRKGYVGNVDYGRQGFKAEVRGLMERYTREICELYTPGCRADLGDSRCTVNLASFTVTGSVTSLTNKRVFRDSARTEADGWFMGGLLTWTGGLNASLKMEVKKWTAATKEFELVLPMYSNVQVGDTYSVYAGCDKTLTTCKVKFNNVLNFRGEPHVPQAQDVAISAVR